MDHQSLVNVLGILREIKRAQGKHTTAQLIGQWAGPVVAAQSTVHKVAAYVTDQIAEARAVINASQLADEAKQGIQQALSGLEQAFSLTGINANPQSHLRDIDGAIANFVILLSAMHLDTHPEAPEEAKDLAKEVEVLVSAFDDVALDPLVRDIAKRHLQTLATLLKHIPIFGLEPALATYFELITKLRRADIHTTQASKDALDPAFEKINSWGTRLKGLDETWNAGARWVGRAGKAAVSLLTYLGGGQ